MLAPCPHCGCNDGVFVKAQARGPAELHYDSDGHGIEVYYDHIYFDHSKTVRCVDCGRIRRDVYLDGLIVKLIP